MKINKNILAAVVIAACSTSAFAANTEAAPKVGAEKFNTVESVAAATVRSQEYSNLKGELSLMKLQLQRDTLQAQLNTLKEKAKTPIYVAQLKKMESYYEGLRAKDKASFEKELKQVKASARAANIKSYEKEIADLKAENERLQGQLLDSFNDKMRIKNKLGSVVNSMNKHHVMKTDMSSVYAIRTEDLLGDQRAQVYFDNHIKWVSNNSLVAQNIKVIEIGADSVTVKDLVSGDERTMPLVSLEFAESRSNMDGLIVYSHSKPEVVVKKPIAYSSAHGRRRLDSSEAIPTNSSLPPLF